MKWHCGNISYSSRGSKKQSTISFVWKKKNGSWPVKKCHSERGARFSARRETICNVGLEKKDLKSDHKLLRQGMTDNRQTTEKWCEEEFKVLQEEYFDEKRSKQTSEAPEPSGTSFSFLQCHIKSRNFPRSQCETKKPQK